MKSYDVVVIGAGPNGLSAAVALARAELSTLVVEAEATPGGGTRTKELTRPGFLHDVCSTVHPLGIASPFLRTLDLDVAWIQPPTPLVHVMPDRTVALERSLDATADALGADGETYRRLLAPYVERFDELLEMVLAPLRFPKHPLLMARFGLSAIRSAASYLRRFSEPAAPAMLAGIAAHSIVPLEKLATMSFGILLAASGHAVGWPVARGGSQAICDALVTKLGAHGGEVVTGSRVTSMATLPPARAYVFDVTPRQLLAIAGERFPHAYRKRLERFRYGPGVFKIDWALRGPVPWRDPKCATAATVHLSGTLDDIARAERAVHAGSVDERPFVLFTQPSLFDASRAPPGQHVGWAYCHVPHDSTFDATTAIEAHVEAYAPGFRDLIIARSTMNAREMSAYNANYIGGDINGGISDLGQLFFRPAPRIDPYATPADDIFICSSSTPPGGGVHGMCGYHAAQSVLRKLAP